MQYFLVKGGQDYYEEDLQYSNNRIQNQPDSEQVLAAQAKPINSFTQYNANTNNRVDVGKGNNAASNRFGKFAG